MGFYNKKPSIDPAIVMRVDKLEALVANDAKLFVEDFKQQSYVDKGKTDATVGTGYVRTDKLVAFKEDYSTTNYYDAENSVGTMVDINNGKLSVDETSLVGTALSTIIPTTGTTMATINVNVREKSTVNFADFNQVSDVSQSDLNESPVSIADRSGRVWTFWLQAKRYLCYRVEDAGGSVVHTNKFSLPNVVSGASTPIFLNVVVDYDNKLWVITGYTTQYYMCINPDFSIFVQPVAIMTSARSTPIDPGIYVDKTQKLWIIYGEGYSLYTRYKIVNTNDGSTIADSSVGGNSAPGFAGKWIHDEVNGKMMMCLFRGGDVYTYVFKDNGTYEKTSQILAQANMSGLDSDIVMDANGKLYLISYNITSKLFTLYNIDWVTLKATKVADLPITNVASGTRISIVRKGDMEFLMAYGAFGNGTNPVIRTIEFDVAGKVVAPEKLVSDSLAHSYFGPHIYFNGSGDMSIVYSTTQNATTGQTIQRAQYKVVNFTVKNYISNDGGSTWHPATSGEIITFPEIGDRLRVKFELKTSVPGYSSEILGYDIIEGNDLPESDSIKTFQSTKLPSSGLISGAMLTATVDESGGGRVEWFLSNDGGLTWDETNLGEYTQFTKAYGSDIRLKAILRYPIGATKPPIIHGYGLTSYNVISASDVHDLQINMMKTNFRIAALSNATKYNMRNMVVDTFTDTTGINVAKTTSTYDGVLKAYKNLIVETLPTEATSDPTLMTIIGEESIESGTVIYYGSRDGGVTWVEAVNDVVNFDSRFHPMGTSLAVKAEMTGICTLHAIAFAWK